METLKLTNCKAYINPTYLFNSSWNFNEYFDLSEIDFTNSEKEDNE